MCLAVKDKLAIIIDNQYSTYMRQVKNAMLGGSSTVIIPLTQYDQYIANLT